ncbi:MAG TPA: hypothetical protein VLJ79_04450 [Candidatus Binatia bacterium]|nr:hypothetical protein [Candidatus Binatia bacterium]
MSVPRIRLALQPYRDVCRTVAYRNSKILSRVLSGVLSLPALLGLLLVAGCATDTVTPTVRAPAGLPRPDRVLVHDFEVANADSELSGDLLPPVSRGTGAAARTEEEMRVGRAAAKVLTASLIQELRSRSIEAQRASEAAPPELNTLSIRGRFLWREKDAGTMRARIWYYQGSGVNSRLVAQVDADIPSESKTGAKIGDSAYTVAQEADARRMARELAERVARYYREQGWIKS